MLFRSELPIGGNSEKSPHQVAAYDVRQAPWRVTALRVQHLGYPSDIVLISPCKWLNTDRVFCHEIRLEQSAHIWKIRCDVQVVILSEEFRYAGCNNASAGSKLYNCQRVAGLRTRGCGKRWGIQKETQAVGNEQICEKCIGCLPVG